jgi:hypothetical protein
MGSAIHPEHIEIFHKNSHDGLMNFWKTSGSDFNVSQMMTYDPYLKRITHPTQEST